MHKMLLLGYNLWIILKDFSFIFLNITSQSKMLQNCRVDRLKKMLKKNLTKCYTHTYTLSVQHKYLMDKCSKLIVHSNVTIWQNYIPGHFSLADMLIYSFFTPQQGRPREAQSIKSLSEMLYHVLCISPILQQMLKMSPPYPFFQTLTVHIHICMTFKRQTSNFNGLCMDFTKMLSTCLFRDTFLTPER